ncbi:hypothetical protein [Falsarthrobacter nasiphocae]|uniref:Intracellular proteinase inhibitor n=1 Tax=Falsarthrobacter nasiphocae TaxID=189863 RepID=A0AAE4C5X4_9MICC|nr:hypothetical protein [Falsarthrobacter nasiphocae]MDR6891953.1 hypothetical protein [Falsarthrobacter nasiphocae]
MPRLSPAVYRRRRIAAVIVLLLLVAIVWGIVAGIVALVRAAGNSAPSSAPAAGPTASATPSAPSSASAAPSASGAEYPLCYDQFVQLEAKPDKEAYGPKDMPVFELKITNISSEACVVNVGTKVMDLSVLNGSQKVFSTTVCRKDAKDLYKNIQPGKSETARFTWNRGKSSGSCSATAAPADPGTYQLVGTLGKVSSAPKTFQLNAQ